MTLAQWNDRNQYKPKVDAIEAKECLVVLEYSKGAKRCVENTDLFVIFLLWTETFDGLSL
jgi:hypothetical protein